jgi:hypothetical protein
VAEPHLLRGSRREDGAQAQELASVFWATRGRDGATEILNSTFSLREFDHEIRN